MRVELLSFRQPVQTVGSESVLHLYTTAPSAPYFLRVNTRNVPCTLEIPSTLPYDNLCVEHYSSYLNEENFKVLNHAGVAVLSAKHFSKSGVATVTLQKDSGTATQFSITLRVTAPTDAPTSQCVYPCTHDCQRLSDEIMNRSTQWYRTMAPINSEITKVHVPTLPCFVPKLPGFFFMVRRPQDYEPEKFFSNALRIAARRRDMSYTDLQTLAATVWAERQARVASPAFRQLARIVVEALSVAPNMMPYNADVELTGGNTHVPVERFSSDSRVNKTGDCEDQAREILNVAYSLQCATYTSPLVLAAQSVCRCYVATQQFGAVRLGANDPSIAPYSTGGELFAHSFVIFQPAGFVAASMQDATLEPYLDGHHESGVEMLATDGIALFDPNPLTPTHPCIGRDLRHLSDLHGGSRMTGVKMRGFNKIGDHYYMFLCSAFVLNGLRSRKGTPVYEFYYSNQPGTYGCPFVELLQKSPQIRLVPTYELSVDEQALAEKCTSVFHPIPAYACGDETQAQAAHASLLSVLQQNRVTVLAPGAQAPPRSRCVTSFITDTDMCDATFMQSLGRALEGKTVRATLEPLADNLYGCQIEFYVPL